MLNTILEEKEYGVIAAPPGYPPPPPQPSMYLPVVSEENDSDWDGYVPDGYTTEDLIGIYEEVLSEAAQEARDWADSISYDVGEENLPLTQEMISNYVESSNNLPFDEILKYPVPKHGDWCYYSDFYDNDYDDYDD